MVTLGSFGLSRSGSRQKDAAAAAAAAQASALAQQQQKKTWENVSICEVSAKQDDGIEDLFLNIASRLVERKIQIEHERVLRSKDSIMIDHHAHGGTDKMEDSTRVWGCC